MRILLALTLIAASSAWLPAAAPRRHSRRPVPAAAAPRRHSRRPASSTPDAPPDEDIVVVTHAGGRFSTSVIAQLREQPPPWATNLRIRAVVRDDAEAARLSVDLAGVALRGGELTLLSPLDDVSIVVSNATTDIDYVFRGATAVVLCSAAHAELEAVGGTAKVRYSEEEDDAAARLAREIGACTSDMQVCLRSSMGVSTNTLDGVEAMGGGAMIHAKLQAERMLTAACPAATVVRLGALTDDAGNVPLSFGSEDSMLLDREGCKDPPLISRNDGARLVAEIVRRGSPLLAGRVFDAAWSPKWGAGAAGSEEAAEEAAAQDLVRLALKAC